MAAFSLATLKKGASTVKETGPYQLWRRVSDEVALSLSLVTLKSNNRLFIKDLLRMACSAAMDLRLGQLVWSSKVIS